MRGLMEPCIAQRSDGSLHMVMRTQLGSVFHSVSTDDGKTWSKAQTTGLRSPESCPCIAAIPGTDAQLVVWNNAEYDSSWISHYGKRTPLTMAISRDGLRSFSDYIDIETDPGRAFTNPSITVTSDGLFLMNYWTSPYLPDGRFRGQIDLKLATFRIKL
jgi:predicted neuraminidase